MTDTEKTQVIETLREVLESFGYLEIALLFGSVASGKAGSNSDLDVAVSAIDKLDLAQKQEIITKVGIAVGRPVDLIDLQAQSGTILKTALTKGHLIFCKNKSLRARLVKRMLFNQADEMPYYFRILRERRHQWIGIS